MKINEDVINILADSTINANKLYLPKVQLERNLYLAVNKVLEAIGGKWNRYEKAHIFSNCPENIIEEILQSGEYTDAKKEYQFFETPDDLAQRLVDLACIGNSDTVLEPSAGKGRIAKYINAQYLKGCDCIELNPECRRQLIEDGFNVVAEDFLTFNKRYDIIVANPPFNKQQDIDHVLHMIELANKRVVSVVSASIMFRENKKTVEFKNKISELGGTIMALPEKSFVESGTNARACVITVELNGNGNYQKQEQLGFEL